jgi:integrase
MSHLKQRRKPWFHAPSGFWCAQIAGKRHYLDRDQVASQRKLNRLLAEQKTGSAGDRDWLDAPFSDLVDEFLDDVKARRAVATYSNYHDMLELALNHLGTGLRVGTLRKLHLLKLEAALHTRAYSPTSIFKALHAVQRVFTWAVEADVLDFNPLLGYKKPRPRQRTRVITPDEFRAMLRHTDPSFRRVLVALRLTGARPGEVRVLDWDNVDLNTAVWVLPEHKTVTRQKYPRPRVIALPDPILKLMQWASRRPHGPHDPVFLNTRGERWTAEAFHSRMTRLRATAGLEPKAGEQIVLYSNRHSYGSEVVGKVSDIELAELMGHTNPATTRRYVHLNHQRLREIQQRAQA